MIGFDSIGQSAIGETGVDVADVLIFAPVASDVTASVTAPIVWGGASVAPAGKTVTIAANVPAIRSGVLVTVPGKAVTVVANAAAVRISATETVPGTAASVTIAAPVVRGGASVSPAGKAVTATRVAPVVTAGKSEFVPGKTVTVAANAPRISISATIAPSIVSVAAAPNPPQILGGNYIEASNTVTMITPYGEIGSSSIGELAIGEGEPSTRIVKIPPVISVSTSPPFVTAGKSVRPTAANVNLTTFRPEIDSRGRKLRVYAIAS